MLCYKSNNKFIRIIYFSEMNAKKKKRIFFFCTKAEEYKRYGRNDSSKNNNLIPTLTNYSITAIIIYRPNHPPPTHRFIRAEKQSNSSY